MVLVVDAGTTVEAGAGSWAERIPLALDRALPWVLLLWCMGVSYFVARLSLGLRTTRRIRRVGIRAVSEELQQLFERVRRRLEVTRAVRLVHSALIEVPTVVGWLRPFVLIPIGALAGMSSEQVEAILAHELAHIRRHDYLVSVMQSVVETVLFYHPAVWWISKQVRRERECCCDEMAVEVGGDVLAYARALSLLEERRSFYPEVALGANGGVLKMRIKRLLGCKEESAASQLVLIAILAVLVLAAGATAGKLAHAQNAAAQSHSSQSSPVQDATEPAAEQSTAVNAKQESGHPLLSTVGQQTTTDTERQIENAQRQLQNAQETLNSEKFKKQINDAQRWLQNAQEKPNSPELKKQIQEVQRQLQDAQKHLNSEQFKKQIDDAQRWLQNAQEQPSSPEFKKQMQDAQLKLQDAQKQMNSEQLKKQIADVQRWLQDAQKNQNSEQFKKQLQDAQLKLQDAQKKLNSEQFMKQIDDAQRQLQDAQKKLNSEQFKKQLNQLLAQNAASGPVPAAPPVPAASGGLVRVPSGVLAGMLLSKPTPIYPERAKEAHVQGPVILHAFISKTGTIKRLEVISGNSMLANAAVDAVQHWTYKPFLLNGEPVEVETSITVNFSLDDSSKTTEQSVGTDVIEKIGGAVSAPVKIKGRNPMYTELARQDKVNGSVMVSLIVDKDGLPQKVHVTRGLGDGLDENAVEAVKQWRFKPAMKDGNPVAVAMSMEVQFKIF
jgi:TonB family protein